MTPGHIRDINTEKSKNKPGESRFHGLTDKQIKHIPDMLKNPVMIYDSISPDNKDNTVCVLTNEFDGDGNPIIVVFKYVEGIEKNVPSYCTVETQNYNMVSSQYGRTNFYNHFLELINKDSVLYVNKSRFEKFINNKTLNFSTGNKVQFLETLEKLGFDRIIHQSRNFVNEKIIKEDATPRNRLKGHFADKASSEYSISRNADFDNTNINENASGDLGSLDNVADDFGLNPSTTQSAVPRQIIISSATSKNK